MSNRLAPVYDAIDDEKYDLAIKICDKAMSKKDVKDFQTLKALKALALCRSGLFQQAYDLAYEVKRTNPIDAPTLQATFLIFKMLHMYDEIVQLYANAFNLSPGNEEWAIHWFMALVRKGDWKALQQVII
jgi:N-terminal acetyltransferase B complex non-catalytic subunit